LRRGCFGGLVPSLRAVAGAAKFGRDCLGGHGRLLGADIRERVGDGAMRGGAVAMASKPAMPQQRRPCRIKELPAQDDPQPLVLLPCKAQLQRGRPRQNHAKHPVSHLDLCLHSGGPPAQPRPHTAAAHWAPNHLVQRPQAAPLSTPPSRSPRVTFAVSRARCGVGGLVSLACAHTKLPARGRRHRSAGDGSPRYVYRHGQATGT